MSAEVQSNLIDLSTHRRTTPIRRIALESVSMEDTSARDAFYDWCDSLRGTFVRLQNLPQDWDGYGAEPISHQVAIFAFQVLLQSWRSELPVPDVTPLSDGSVLIEWFGSGSELTIEVHAPYEMTYFTPRQEGEIGKDLSQLFHILDDYVRENSLAEAS